MFFLFQVGILKVPAVSFQGLYTKKLHDLKFPNPPNQKRPKIYKSYHNHGSQKLVPPIVVTFQITIFQVHDYGKEEGYKQIPCPTLRPFSVSSLTRAMRFAPMASVNDLEEAGALEIDAR